MSATNFRVRYRLTDAPITFEGELTDLSRIDVQALDLARPIKNYRGQTHVGGWYYFVKAKRHLRFESGLERLRLMLLDYDPDITLVAPQPFQLLFHQEGRALSHVPDLLIVRPGRVRLVEDVKPLKFVDRPANVLAFAATRQACERAGLEYSVWSEPPAVVAHNIRYLAGYRRVPQHLDEYAPVLLDLARDTILLGTLASLAGPNHWVRPVLYHLVWTHRLTLDLTRPLSNRSEVSPGSRYRGKT
ncbi:TnsA-like heteromeric transposase endonuclease subunit [Deinococcus planocerae]|uniref:TnsA-like heteromeric transposase endonuclease subunit n=1 Tax=Deinococcus planocerae TaxID=1737569 RepID=UPI0015E0DBA7|nr:TnsA-like heteromeric transposase endonuclease subunit [Deinococcus planocerae]